MEGPSVIIGGECVRGCGNWLAAESTKHRLTPTLMKTRRSHDPRQPPRYNMTLAKKLFLAFATILFSPAIITCVAFGRFSRDNVDISIPAFMYLLPLFLVALFLRALNIRKGATAVYIFAITTLWAELHGPVIGQVYIPTIVLTFPFGLMAILHKSKAAGMTMQPDSEA
jgi:hypothetical protein